MGIRPHVFMWKTTVQVAFRCKILFWHLYVLDFIKFAVRSF